MTAPGRRSGLLRRPLARLLKAGDRLLFPEGDSPERHWQRLVLNESVRGRIAAADPPSCSAVEISGCAHRAEPWREYATLDYPDFDLCAPLEEQRRFDVVICEQVLEHVVDPIAAAINLGELCVPGGQVIVSSPFLVRVHEVPLFAMNDYWRFTPRGLRTLLERANLEVEEVGAWGNRECVVANFNRWPECRRWHSLRNEPDFPLQVWAFARRPG